MVRKINIYLFVLFLLLWIYCFFLLHLMQGFYLYIIVTSIFLLITFFVKVKNLIISSLFKSIVLTLMFFLPQELMMSLMSAQVGKGMTFYSIYLKAIIGSIFNYWYILVVFFLLIFAVMKKVELAK